MYVWYTSVSHAQPNSSHSTLITSINHEGFLVRHYSKYWPSKRNIIIICMRMRYAHAYTGWCCVCNYVNWIFCFLQIVQYISEYGWSRICTLIPQFLCKSGTHYWTCRSQNITTSASLSFVIRWSLQPYPSSLVGGFKVNWMTHETDSMKRKPFSKLMEFAIVARKQATDEQME